MSNYHLSGAAWADLRRRRVDNGLGLARRLGDHLGARRTRAARRSHARGRSRSRGRHGAGAGQAVLEAHPVLWRQAHARAHHVRQGLALPEERVHHRRATGHQRRLEHERQKRQHRVHARAGRLLGVASRRLRLGTGAGRADGSLSLGGGRLEQRDALAQLGNDDEVNDERRRQQRVLARVVHRDSVRAPHEDLGRVLVHGTLRVLDRGNVLDHHGVVRVLALRVQQLVRGDHVVDNVALGDLLRPELLRRRQVLAVVVAEVVVGDDRCGLDSGTN
mmetsp:Transcript_55487/g.133831  ORF Transcript_55487/g.133831 Transcript_55487/m.133831 type:complete len:276 (-) Transcript_55487:966-1793(-)